MLTAGNVVILSTKISMVLMLSDSNWKYKNTVAFVCKIVNVLPVAK
jgi:hypothetical protein